MMASHAPAEWGYRILISHSGAEWWLRARNDLTGRKKLAEGGPESYYWQENCNNGDYFNTDSKMWMFRSSKGNSQASRCVPRLRDRYPYIVWSCGQCAQCLSQGWHACSQRRIYANVLATDGVKVTRVACPCGQTYDSTKFFREHLALRHSPSRLSNPGAAPMILEGIGLFQQVDKDVSQQPYVGLLCLPVGHPDYNKQIDLADTKVIAYIPCSLAPPLGDRAFFPPDLESIGPLRTSEQQREDLRLMRSPGKTMITASPGYAAVQSPPSAISWSHPPSPDPHPLPPLTHAQHHHTAMAQHPQQQHVPNQHHQHHDHHHEHHAQEEQEDSEEDEGHENEGDVAGSDVRRLIDGLNEKYRAMEQCVETVWKLREEIKHQHHCLTSILEKRKSDSSVAATHPADFVMPPPLKAPRHDTSHDHVHPSLPPPLPLPFDNPITPSSFFRPPYAVTPFSAQIAASPAGNPMSMLHPLIRPSLRPGGVTDESPLAADSPVRFVPPAVGGMSSDDVFVGSPSHMLRGRSEMEASLTLPPPPEIRGNDGRKELKKEKVG
ncbi:unnamed protein product [Vitrella brassicaformis CCMP3155]|uniref:Uncharacterized protein n=2 Tax=Vitrella brassicaformis TaxID=1169539 RepID=A0A0G4EK20_VITBC|nr:unnamed protein product [Vitrella brassicaformis CCMP3155]|eukprot:CEL96860.1 unnamed protein product [Vitrella brassicaformis CCMP3155]